MKIELREDTLVLIAPKLGIAELLFSKSEVTVRLLKAYTHYELNCCFVKSHECYSNAASSCGMDEGQNLWTLRPR